MRWRLIPVDENSDTAKAANEVISTNVLLSKSATKTIPKGASQFDAFKVRIPEESTLDNNLIDTKTPKNEPIPLITRCVAVFRQVINWRIAANKWINTGPKM